MATADVEGLSAADANDLNARALYERYRWWQGGERHWWPLGGYRRLIDKLAKNLARRIHMAHAVTKIERMVDGGRVRVTTQNQKQFEAARVVVSVPLGVLQKGAIQFAPRLSRAKRAAIRGTGMGDVVKIAIRCRPFWGKYRFIASERDIPVWWPRPQRHSGNGVIIGWAAGRAAKELHRLGADEIKRRAVTSLRELFKGSVDARLEDACVVDWRREEFTRGAYSYDRCARGSTLRWWLAEPEDNLLFFAGEATEPLYYGTVHGALKSGERAATLVLESLGVCA